MLVKLPLIDLVDDREDKPFGIQSHIGRRPIAAFGNCDGDLHMLQRTTAGSGPGFSLIVHHDDDDDDDDHKRKWAYDRTSHIGKLDKAWDEAAPEGLDGREHEGRPENDFSEVIPHQHWRFATCAQDSYFPPSFSRSGAPSVG